MPLTIALPPETERILRERAAQAGQTAEGFVCQLVEREVTGSNGSQTPEAAALRRCRTFDEIFAPLRKEVEESGISAGELDSLLEDARNETRQEPKAKQDKGS